MANDHIQMTTRFLPAEYPDKLTGAAQIKEVSQISSDGLSFLRKWSLEILSWMLAVVTLLAIALLLIVLDHKRLQQLALGLQLTTILSILANVIEGFLAVPLAAGIGQIMWNRVGQRPRIMHDLIVFESASRGGAWGHLKLLFHKHYRYAFRAYAVRFDADSYTVSKHTSRPCSVF